MQLRLALSGLVADSMLKGLDADKNKTGKNSKLQQQS